MRNKRQRSRRPYMWTQLDYGKRMRITIGFSLIVHLIMFTAASLIRTEGPGLAITPHDDPIKVTLTPDSLPKRLIDATEPAQEAPDESTDLISETDSNARDMSEEEGTRVAPHVEETETYDAIGGPEEPSPETPPAPAPPPAVPEAPKPQDPPETDKLEEAMIQALAESPLPDPPVPETKEADKVQLAQLDPPAPVTMKPGDVKGRADGGTDRKGLLSYEAMAHQFAPYLKEVRATVERRWKALMLNYTGARTTSAVVDCSIGPDGQLLNVEIVEPGDSATYAALCKRAILDAGPFKPFPFRVPEIYSEETLDIRWTFSFL